MVESKSGSGPEADRTKVRNIESGDVDEPGWQRDDLSGSLEGLRKYVLGTAERSERWYWKRKVIKARLATTIQWIAILATGLAGLVPIAAKLTLFAGVSTWLRARDVGQVDSGLLASLLIGGGAALLGIDRVAGLSSGWTRYVLTATAIRAASEEFRLDWAALSAESANPPTAEQSAVMIRRAKLFSLAIEALITKETQDWATEFRNNMNSLERDLKVQVDQAKVESDKAERDAKAKTERQKVELQKAAQPGAIEASVSNASGTDDFQFEAKLENGAGLVASESVKGAETWTRIAVPAGQYKLTITASINRQTVFSSAALDVEPGETTKSQLALPSVPPATRAPV